MTERTANRDSGLGEANTAEAVSKKTQVPSATSEEQYRLLFENSSSGIAICDVVLDAAGVPVDFINVEVNAAHEAHSGLRADKIVGRRITETLPDAELGPIIARYGHVALTGEAVTFETYVPSLNRHFSIRVYRIAPLRIALVFSDISARKWQEAAMAKQVEILRAFVEQSPVAKAMLDTELRYLAASERWIADYQLEDTPILGRSHYDVFPEIEERWKAIHRRCLAGATERCEEDAFVRADGTTTWLRWDVRPWRTDDGTIGGILMTSEDITERKRAVDSLTLFRALIDKSGDAFEVVDPDTAKFLDINETGHTCLGFTREEFLALRVPDIDPLVDDAEFREIVNELRRAGNVSIERVHRRKDGSDFPVEINCSLIKLGREYVVALVRDISARKSAEEILRASEARYRTLLESIPQNIMIKDRESRYVSINENYARLLGIRPEEVVGKTDYDFFPRDLAEKYRGDDKRIMESGETDDFDEQYLRDGKKIWIHTVKAPVRDDSGTVMGVLVTFWDITEHKSAQDKLHLQAMVLEAAANAIVITDIQGTIEWVNPAFTALSGYSLEEAVGRNPRDLVKSGQHDKGYYREMWETIAAGRVWQGELVNRRKDGTLYTEVQTITPIRDRAGVITHFAGIKLDVSDYKRLEQELIQAQKMESVGILAGGVAHDFNNLLTVISGYTEMALSHVPEDSAIFHDLTAVHRAAQSAASLTRQLLAFSRKQVMRLEVLDLNRVLGDCAMMLQRLVGEDIAFIVKKRENLWPVLADAGQMEQVLMNLVVNSRDAMPNGGSVVIETSNIELDQHLFERHSNMGPGRYVCVAVSDTGAGMDKATQERIFEPFFTTKGIGRGTGLGLATVYGIVKQSGGSIFVYSEVGHGTTFKIYLPRAQAPGQDMAAPAAPVLARQGAGNILLVEDEDALRGLAERILVQSGYRVISAADGAEAIAIFEQRTAPIDLIVTDVIMPGMSGSELAHRIHEHEPHVKVLFMSGYTDTAIAAHGVLGEGQHLLGKPFSAMQLTQKVREVLEEKP